MQAVLFVSEEVPPSYPAVNNHYYIVPVHGDLSFERLSELWSEHSPLVVLSYGDQSAFAGALSTTFAVRRLWFHMDKMPQAVDIPSMFFPVAKTYPDTEKDPLISVFTTTFNSKHKIFRPFESLRRQTYTHWEWVVWDDSEDTETYENLLKMQKQDLRIKVYRAPRHSGIIGEMKRRACDVAHGAILAEVDHDDDLDKDLLQWIVDASHKHPDAVFFYTDCCELSEDTFESVSYGDYVGFGFVGHYKAWSDMHQRWIIASRTLLPNAFTVNNLVSSPNHVRAWRSDFYRRIGGHNPLLSVADDYDLMARTFNEGGVACLIRRNGYFQYRNRDGNFTFIRNSLIQHNLAGMRNFHFQPGENELRGDGPYWKHDDMPFSNSGRGYIYDPVEYDGTIAVINPRSIADIEAVWSPNVLVVAVGNEAAFEKDIPDKMRANLHYWDLPGYKDAHQRENYAKNMLRMGETWKVVHCG